jgi:hypothetical protein
VKESYTLSVCTSLTHPSGFAVTWPTVRNNDAWDFFREVVHLLNTGFLVGGDLLVRCS